MTDRLPKGWYWIGAAVISLAFWYAAFLLIGLCAAALRGWK